MLDLLPDLRGWLGGGARVALARVVDLDGSGPRLPGAAMAISDDGRVAGSVSGGCIESAVVTEALDVLDDGAARLVRFGYSDDDAVAVGLTCGGTVHVFIEVVTASRWAAIERIAAAVAEDRPAAVATVVAGPGAGAWVDLAGDRAGDRAVPADATADRAQAGAAWAGSLGDPGLDRVVRRDVIGEMASGRSGVRRYGSSGEAGADDVAVFIETFAPPPRMIIFGAIDFTAALARVGKILGFHVTVCDARAVFATSLRFPMADQVLVDWPHRYLDRCGAALGANDAVCVLTHDHKFDVPAIAAALATRCGYIGALGSRRTTEERARRLRAAGVTDAALRRVRAPIGLDLGARTPEETAIAICAEIITVRTGHAAGPLRDGTGPLHDASTGSLIRSPTGGLARLGDVEAEFPPTMPTKPARPERE